MGDDLDIQHTLKAAHYMDWEAVTLKSPKEIMKCCQPPTLGCLIVDVEHFRSTELNQQSHHQSNQWPLPTIFTATSADVPATVRVMKAGAIAMLLKPISIVDLIRAVKEAIQISSKRIEKHAAIQVLHDCHSSLTKREQEVMALVVTGLLNKQIAFNLGISEITVKAHRGAMMRKMHARSLAELVLMGANLGLVVITYRDILAVQSRTECLTGIRGNPSVVAAVPNSCLNSVPQTLPCTPAATEYTNDHRELFCMADKQKLTPRAIPLHPAQS